MFQVRFHGRGGQGVVTAAELLSLAAFLEGEHAQAFPSFGSERTGAPVVSFCRINERPIRNREPVLEPDAVVVQDVTLVGQIDVLAGLAKEGYLLINTGHPIAELALGDLGGHRSERLRSVPATELALEHIGRPVPNAVLLGGLAALTGIVSLGALSAAITERFPAPLAEANVAAASAAFVLIAGDNDKEPANAATA